MYFPDNYTCLISKVTKIHVKKSYLAALRAGKKAEREKKQQFVLPQIFEGTIEVLN